jgi:DNA-binding LacI/PurR family transcriptional regulator
VELSFFDDNTYTARLLKLSTIRDIAEKLHINPSTVSRALNGQKGVSENLRQQILELAQSMSYKKELLSNSILTPSTPMIGLILPDITNPYYAFIAKGVSLAFENTEYSLLLCNTDRNYQTEKRYIQTLCNNKVKGVIILSVTAKEDDIQPFFDNNIPIVCMDNPLSKKVSCVMNDNYSGTCDLIEHMLALGIKRLSLLMGLPEFLSTKQRYRAVVDTLEQHAKSEILVNVMNIAPTYEDAYNATPELLKKNPDTIFAINDTVALGVMNYCFDNNIKIPGELKIAGYDDISSAATLPVPLTTVHQRKTTLGIQAANLLLQHIDDPSMSAKKIELFPKLIVRKSLGE